MNAVNDLIRAAVENPNEDTPVHMLADELTENGDGRGELLRQWATQPEKRLRGRDWYGRDQLGEGDSGFLFHRDPSIEAEETGLQTSLSADKDHLKWHIIAQLPVREARRSPDKVTVPSRQFVLKTSIPEARDIADNLPNSKEVHQFLDTHFGPDPRYADALNEALKPKLE